LWHFVSLGRLAAKTSQNSTTVQAQACERKQDAKAAFRYARENLAIELPAAGRFSHGREDERQFLAELIEQANPATLLDADFPGTSIATCFYIALSHLAIERRSYVNFSIPCARIKPCSGFRAGLSRIDAIGKAGRPGATSFPANGAL
jgi:hypothetical protein